MDDDQALGGGPSIGGVSAVSGAGTGAGGTLAGGGAGSGGIGGALLGGSSGDGALGGTGNVAGGSGAGGEGDGGDDCPDDPDKVAPGECGCGIPEVATASLADCHSLEAALIHRYDFEGTGTKVIDRVGDADGSIARGSTLTKVDGRGVVLFGGGDQGTYVDLPNQLISVLTSVTLEAWITWGGGNKWQRIFDFGCSDAGENNVGMGKSYLFLTPLSDANEVEVTFSTNGSSSPDHVTIGSGPPLLQELSQVVVVASSTDNVIRLYVNGAKRGEAAWIGELSTIEDVNNWLGRSQFGQDPELNGIFHDFRIYDQALTDAQIAASFIGGPDPSFLSD